MGLAMAFLLVLRPFPCGNFRAGQITIERYTINNNNNRNHHNARGPTEWHHVRRRRRSRKPRTPLDRSPPPFPFAASSSCRFNHPSSSRPARPFRQARYIIILCILYTRTRLLVCREIGRVLGDGCVGEVLRSGIE